MRLQRSERVLASISVIAGVALLLALFAPWYTVDYASLSRTSTGFFLMFGSKISDAWNAVTWTSVVLAMCALGIVIFGAMVIHGRRNAAIQAAIAVLALGVAGYRLLEPPTHQVTIGTAGYFSRSNHVPSGHQRSQALEAHWGVWAAVCASLLAAAGTTATLAARRRRAP
jgi:hypothetical protein